MSKSEKQRLREYHASLPRRPSLTPKPSAAVFTVEDRLNAILTQLIGGPTAPDKHHMMGAAHAFLLIQDLGLKCISTTAETILAGENVHGINFLERAGRHP
jgi:hypothetical protein